MKLKNGMAIFCENKEQANEFFKKCVELKFRWSSDKFIDPMKDSDNRFCEDGTYYFINNNVLTFSTVKSSNGIYNYVNFNDLFKSDSKFKVGDKVRVIDKGKQYSTYRDFIKNKLPKRLKDFKYGEVVPCDEEYKVVFVEKREDDNEYICVIEDLNTKQIFMIQDIGVELIKEEKKMNKCKVYEMPEYVGSNINKVIINEPCVIVILNSGEKGVAKCCPEDKFIEERGYKLALARAIKEKYLNDVVRQDELIKQYIEEFEYKNTIKYYRNEFDKLQRLRSK